MKDKLQAELLEKIKPGIKASDLKRPRRIIKPKPQKDEGYSSGEEKKPIVPKAPPLPNNQDLQAQIQALQKQLQLYKDFKETDLKIKEQYKETIADLQTKNSELSKTIATMESQAEPKENIKPEPIKTFLCSECNQTKPQDQLSRVFGKFSFCLSCSKQARQEASQQKEAKPQEFTCHLCEKPKTEIANLMKLDSTLTEYLVCNSCRPHAKEFNEADLITDDLWTKYPYSSASEILEKEFGITRK